MIVFFNIVTVVFSSLMFGRNFKNILSNPSYVFYLVFFVFYVVPLFLDVFLGPCDYSYSTGYMGFEKSQHDVASVLIYDFFIIYTQYMVLKKIPSISTSQILINTGNNNKLRLWLLVGGLIPIIATILLLKNTSMLYTFSWRELELFPTTGSYSTIERFCYLGICCFVILIFEKYKRTINIWRIIAVLGVFCCVCIQGKRASLFFVAMAAVIAFYFRFVSPNFSFKKIASILLVAVGSYFVLQSLFMYSVDVKLGRGYDPNRTDILYTTTRIDMFRDDRMKMAIYSQLNDDMKILDYPCQTFLGDILTIIPINYVASIANIHAITYQTYFTCAMMNGGHNDNLVATSNNSWMTVSMFSEIFSNLSFILGILIAPILILWFAENTMKQSENYIKCLFAFSFVLLNLFDFSYVIVVFEATLIAYWINKKKRNKIIYKSKNDKDSIYRPAPKRSWR